MRRRLLAKLAPVAAVLMVLPACGAGDTAASPSAETTTTEAPAIPATPYEAFRAQPTACGADRPDAVTPMTFAKPEDEGLDLTQKVTVTIVTSCGDLVVELDPQLAPFTVNSFVFLANQGFYDGVVSHRIMPGFMFQIGDPTASGGGDAGYLILVDEWPEQGFSFERGVVAMANAGPQTTGSQFFVMLGARDLPPNYTVIGRLVEGDEVLDAIGEIPVAPRPSGEESLPLESLYIETIRIAGAG